MPVIPDAFLDDVARRFALLGDPTRLRILRAMHEGGEGTVGEIAEAAGTSVANASQHLQRLTAGGIAARRRDGQAVRYRIVDETIEQLCTIVCGSVARGLAPQTADTTTG
ncbi:ArsR/SmtB family transcription factor [Streptomyces sp. NPDC101225]|uniref:ArsR/SmtB family transcription factor n=1 Tax=Streptomyces sp. NPDC101225 TaxID=3366135 RepID=UPI0037F785B5